MWKFPMQRSASLLFVSLLIWDTLKLEKKKKKEKRGITVMWFKAQFVPGVMKVMGHGGYTTAARVSKIWKAGKYAEAVQDSDNCF